MIKLFLRNKLVEIGNFLYEYKHAPLVLLFACIAGAVLCGLAYVLGFLTPMLEFGRFPEIASRMGDGSTIEQINTQIEGGMTIIGITVFFAVIIGVIAWVVHKIGNWIRSNIKLAKDGVKVRKEW